MAIFDFLQTGQDIDFSFWRDLKNHSLRFALLRTLYSMCDPSSEAANQYVLRNTTVPGEVFLAAKNLEHFSPGVYRAEVLRAVADIFARKTNFNNAGDPWEDHDFCEIVGYYRAREFLPQIEEEFILINCDPARSRDRIQHQYVNALLCFPPEDQVPILRRLLTHRFLNNASYSSYSSSIRLTSDVLNIIFDLDFNKEIARKFVREVFEKMDEGAKNCFLVNLHGYDPTPAFRQFGTNTVPKFLISSSWSWSWWRHVEDEPPRKTQVEGTLQLLNELEPFATTQSVKAILRKKRAELLEMLPNAK